MQNYVYWNTTKKKIIFYKKKKKKKKKKINSFFLPVLRWGHLCIMLKYKNTEKKVFFQGEACTVRVMFRVSKTAKIKKTGF